MWQQFNLLKESSCLPSAFLFHVLSSQLLMYSIYIQILKTAVYMWCCCFLCPKSCNCTKMSVFNCMSLVVLSSPLMFTPAFQFVIGASCWWEHDVPISHIGKNEVFPGPSVRFLLLLSSSCTGFEQITMLVASWLSRSTIRGSKNYYGMYIAYCVAWPLSDMELDLWCWTSNKVLKWIENQHLMKDS